MVENVFGLSSQYIHTKTNIFYDLKSIVLLSPQASFSIILLTLFFPNNLLSFSDKTC